MITTILLSFHSRKWRLVWIDINVIPLQNKIQLITTEIYSLKYIISFFSQYGISNDWNMFFNQYYFHYNRNYLFNQFCFFFPGKRACRFPGDPSHGRITPVKFLYEVGDRILIQCNSGFVNTGRQKLQCTDNGSWSDRMPTCLSYLSSSP